MTISRKAMAARRDASNSANARALRAVVIPITKAAGPEPGKSKAVSEDAFAALAKTGRVVSPPFDLLTLAMVNEHNSEMTPVVDAMATNIEGFGYGFKLAVGMRDASDELKREVARERVRLTNFFNNANLRDSFIKLRRKMRRDLELTGNAYLEVIRNAAGQIQGFAHLPSYQVRLGLLEDDPVKIAVPIIELQEDGSRKIVEVGTWERFRTFAQSRLTPFQGLHVSEGGVLLRWFKEFGDPRVYDNRVGEAVPAEKVANWDGSGGAMPEELRANEVVHFSLYSCRSPYGLPRYIGNLLSIFGARAAEEINYLTFTNNNIPSMLLLVANGQITQGSLDRIKAFAESTIQGSDNYSKFLIIEAEGDLEGEDAGNVKLEVKPLAREQHSDALFQNYSKNAQLNVRRAFRIPPILVGASTDYTRAVAETSRRLADEQVFAPERDDFDDFVNRRLFPAMGVRYHKFKSNSPNTTDNAELVRMLSGAEKTGGMTPRIARSVLEDILGAELPPFPDDERLDPDLPFSLAMAEAVKNRADTTEPGQTVTALKALLGFDEQEISDETVALVELLRQRVERLWEDRVGSGE